MGASENVAHVGPVWLVFWFAGKKRCFGKSWFGSRRTQASPEQSEGPRRFKPAEPAPSRVLPDVVMKQAGRELVKIDWLGNSYSSCKLTCWGLLEIWAEVETWLISHL